MNIYVAAIVPIHNELESTKLFIASYYSSLNKSSLKYKSKLIIIDDGSEDNSSKWISEHYPTTTLLRGDGDLWWSGSVNFALKHINNMSFSHLLLFNNDNVLDDNYFNNLIDEINVDNYNIISSMVINKYPKPYVIYGGIIFDRNTSKYIVNQYPDRPCIVNTAGGMGVLIPMDVIDKVGLFDEKNFPQKSGDTDFYLRAEKMGIMVHYCPSLIIYNDNRISGYSDNTSIHGIIQAYSFPKGYMNLKVDLKLFIKHGNLYWSIYEIVKKNIIFIIIGIVRIIRTSVKNV